MNDEYRQKLYQGLGNLIAAQSEVMEARDHGKGDYQKRGEAIERRERIEKGIMDFVESLIEDVDDPLFGTLVYDDPRANLRLCYVHDCGEAFFHSFHTDGNGDQVGIIEYPNGQVQVELAHLIRFTDVEEAEPQKLEENHG